MKLSFLAALAALAIGGQASASDIPAPTWAASAEAIPAPSWPAEASASKCDTCTERCECGCQAGRPCDCHTKASIPAASIPTYSYPQAITTYHQSYQPAPAIVAPSYASYGSYGGYVTSGGC